MITIYKYKVPVQDDFELNLPAGAKLLSVQTQGNTPCMWMLVDTEVPKKLVKFAVRGTGHDCTNLNDDAWKYLGTFQLNGGQLIFHLFTHAPVSITIEPNDESEDAQDS